MAVDTRPGGDPAGSRPTFGDSLSGRDNAFGLLRLILASFVIVDHAFPLGGFGEDPMWRWSQGQESIGGICVAGFFVLSGYLITRSAQRADLLQYLWRRCLRIFPAFWGALILAAFVVGPVVYALAHGSVAGYFTTAFPGPFTYLGRNWTLEIDQYGLLDVYARTPYGHQVGWSILNGSLWTLIYEWKCYLIVGALAAFGVFSRARILVAGSAAALLALAAVSKAFPTLGGSIAPWFGDPHFVILTMLFLIGATIALFRDVIPFDDRIGVLALLVFGWTLFHGGYVLMGYPALAYGILWLAGRIPAPIRRIASVNDYSYGIYVYGFLVQMTLAEYGVHKWGYLPFVIASWLVTLVIAMGSWHLVEKRALRLKDWGPGRGWRYWLSRLPHRRVADGEPIRGVTAGVADADADTIPAEPSERLLPQK